MSLSDEQLSEIAAVREVSFQTGRPTAAALEAILHQAIPVLDHGFIRVVDYMGNDAAVVQAARVSYGAGTRSVRDDEALINYLVRHHHTTPFEMASVKLHVKLPIFVARQWIRHRTASVNEYSARYSILDREFYIPNVEDVASQSTSNRQGRGASVSQADAEAVRKILREDAERNYAHYEWLINTSRDGSPTDVGRPQVARELARINLSLNTYTQWYWSIDLHNLLNFLRLRFDAHAQAEIRAYAKVVADIVEAWVPATFRAFVEHALEGTRLSKTATDVLNRSMAGESITFESSGLSRREWDDLRQKFPRIGQ